MSLLLEPATRLKGAKQRMQFKASALALAALSGKSSDSEHESESSGEKFAEDMLIEGLRFCCWCRC